MISIKPKKKTKSVAQKLAEIPRRQIPFAASKAINDTLYKIRLEEIKGMKNDLHKPIGFTTKGVLFDKSSKKDLKGKVYIRDIQAQYLSYQVEGGTRKPKNKSLPIPGSVKLTKAGNIPKKAVSKMLKNKKRYFSGLPTGKGWKSKVPGIWERQGAKGRENLTLRMVWKGEVKYDKDRYDFYGIANNTTTKYFEKKLVSAINFAIRTAK